MAQRRASKPTQNQFVGQCEVDLLR